MRIAVMGASGRAGRRVVEHGLARGHRITALARRRESIQDEHDNLVVEVADALDPDRLVAALADCDAVVSALGIGRSRAATDVYSAGTANLLGAMGANGINKVAVISAAPVGPRAEQPFLERRVLMPVLERVFGATYADMRRMESALRASDVDWISLRPPRLINKPALGHYRVQTNGPLPRARSITFADLACALLDSLGRRELYRRAVVVAN